MGKMQNFWRLKQEVLTVSTAFEIVRYPDRRTCCAVSVEACWTAPLRRHDSPGSPGSEPWTQAHRNKGRRGEPRSARTSWRPATYNRRYMSRDVRLVFVVRTSRPITWTMQSVKLKLTQLGEPYGFFNFHKYTCLESESLPTYPSVRIWRNQLLNSHTSLLFARIS